MFNLFNKPTPESEARAYCRSIGANPDVLVRGWNRVDGGREWGMVGGFEVKPRWQWYLGVSEAALRRPL